jgi:hypothetical protein
MITRQMVCYEHGKSALTSYHIENSSNNQTRITFFPHTGRTHQLRVHVLIHPGSMRLFWVTTYMEVWQTGFTFMRKASN